MVLNRINNIVNNIFIKLQKISLNSNQIKIIAIITMIIDHVGYYFESHMQNYIYIALRIIGRVSMPLFSFLIVQGFFYTKNLKKYILRIFSVALITQLSIFLVSMLDKNRINLSVNTQLNILFSYTLSLITLWVIHEKNIVEKYTYNQNMFIKIFIIFIIIGVFVFIPIDYGVYVPLFIVMLYLIERLKITIYLEKQNNNMSMKKMLTSFISEKNIKLGYFALITIALLIIIVESGNNMYWYMLFSIIPISMYNGKRGNKSKNINLAFYSIFPIHHFLLYFLSLV